VRRIAVLSKAHQLAKEPTPCAGSLVRELLAQTRRGYDKRRAPAQAARAHRGAAASGAGDLRQHPARISLQDTKAFIIVSQCLTLAAGTLAKAASKRWRKSCVTSRSSAAPCSVSISW
jgi:hypothetical protein